MNQKIKDGTNYTIGAGVGYASYKYIPKILFKKPFEKYYLGKFHSVSKIDNDTFFNSAQKTFKTTGLKEKGVSIINVDNKNVNEITENVIKEAQEKDKERREKQLNKLKEYFRKRGKEYKPSKAEKKIDEWLKKFTDRMNRKMRKHLKEIAKGENACYAPDVQKVLLNKEKMGFSTFHELGHGISWHSHGFRKFNAVLGNFTPFAIPLLLAVGLLKNKKKDKQENKGFWNKITTFIKNNCGLLAGACFVPVLIEEGLASHSGAKMAKTVLNKNMYKKLIKLQKTAYSSYILGTLITMGMVTLAVKLRDKIVDKKIV